MEVTPDKLNAGNTAQVRASRVDLPSGSIFWQTSRVVFRLGDKHFFSFVIVLSLSVLCLSLGRAEDRIWVDGKINNQPVRLIFDTGAGGPVLWKQSAGRLGLKFTLPTDRTPTSPSSVVVGQTEFCEFNLSGSIHKMWFAVYDLPDFIYARDKGDGVLGWGALENDIYLIDASANKVTALAVLPEKVKAWKKFRIQANEGVLLFEIPVKGSTNTVLIDTGKSAGISLAPKTWRAWKKQHKTKQVALRAGYMPASGVYVSEEGWADKISFGSLIVKDVPVAEANASEVDFPSCQASFGMAALRRLELVIDGAKGIAYVNPRSQPATPYEHNRLGAVFVPNDWQKDDDLIARVVPGGPAQKAGIRNGDVLLKVGSQDITKWRTATNISRPSQFWSQPHGTMHRLTLRRGQQTNEVTVKLENILGPGKP